MKLKLFLMGLVIGVMVTSCAHAPATQIVDVPVAVHANKIVIAKCPELPIVTLTPDSTWDQRLKGWQASLVIVLGCLDARDAIIEELNK
jgi:hypothetical protein